MALSPMKIEITEDHLLLLKRMNLRWDNDAYEGAPSVDIKRPYGNSDVWGDIAEILGWWEPVTDKDYDDGLPDEIAAKCEAIHGQMANVLQALVQNPTNFSAGTWINTSKGAPYSVEYTKQPAYINPVDDCVADDPACVFPDKICKECGGNL